MGEDFLRKRARQFRRLADRAWERECAPGMFDGAAIAVRRTVICWPVGTGALPPEGASVWAPAPENGTVTFHVGLEPVCSIETGAVAGDLRAGLALVGTVTEVDVDARIVCVGLKSTNTGGDENGNVH